MMKGEPVSRQEKRILQNLCRLGLVKPQGNSFGLFSEDLGNALVKSPKLEDYKIFQFFSQWGIIFLVFLAMLAWWHELLKSNMEGLNFFSILVIMIILLWYLGIKFRPTFNKNKLSRKDALPDIDSWDSFLPPDSSSKGLLKKSLQILFDAIKMLLLPSWKINLGSAIIAILLIIASARMMQVYLNYWDKPQRFTGKEIFGNWPDNDGFRIELPRYTTVGRDTRITVYPSKIPIAVGYSIDDSFIIQNEVIPWNWIIAGNIWAGPNCSMLVGIQPCEIIFTPKDLFGQPSLPFPVNIILTPTNSLTNTILKPWELQSISDTEKFGDLPFQIYGEPPGIGGFFNFFGDYARITEISVIFIAEFMFVLGCARFLYEIDLCPRISWWLFSWFVKIPKTR
ncbi:MAG: hypothetical protein EXR62_16605 [Chloroflexi bacterium]|nr:hypothetical protein [Chloroflexota bacterium]